MKNFYKYCRISFFILLFQNITTISQAQTDSLSSLSISIMPQIMIKNGLRIDFDLKTNKNQWLNLGTTIYQSTPDTLTERTGTNKRISKLVGFGLELNHRIFLNEYTIGSGEYIQFGLMYNHIKIKCKNSENLQITEKINKTGIQINYGYQTVWKQFLIFDIFAGLGFRLSKINSDSSEEVEFTNSFYDWSYSGPILTGGIRFGILFPAKIRRQ